MQRRTFLKDTGKVAVGIGVFGSIQWRADRFIGDTPTTTDILGPFYRPNAPVRTNINPAAYSGKLFHLRGTIFKEDGKTPFKNGLIEVWQCDSNKVYDNASDEYRYRGSQKTDAKGSYHFITCHPIPYPTDDKGEHYRPAHIHMRISGDGQQDLVTQIYFKDDPYLQKDDMSAAPKAVNRILPIRANSKGEELVQFDVVLANEYKPSDAAFKKICGIYQLNTGSMIEFYRSGDLLMTKENGQITGEFYYKGKNTFENAEGFTSTFELQADGGVKACGMKLGATECGVTGTKVFTY